MNKWLRGKKADWQIILLRNLCRDCSALAGTATTSLELGRAIAGQIPEYRARTTLET